MSDKKLYIEPIEGQSINSVSDLIRSLYAKPDGKPHWGARTTYSDEECTVHECSASRRSFEDLLCLAQTYFPDTDEVSLMSVMAELSIHFNYCPDIFKFVFHFGASYRVNYLPMWSAEVRHYADGTYKIEDLVDIYKRSQA